MYIPSLGIARLGLKYILPFQGGAVSNALHSTAQFKSIILPATAEDENFARPPTSTFNTMAKNHGEDSEDGIKEVAAKEGGCQKIILQCRQEHEAHRQS